MEMEIMSMDTSNMSEEQQQYYAQKRLEILRGGLDGENLWFINSEMSQNHTDSSFDMTDELWHTVINSDSDEELQMLCRVALEEESENLRRRTRVHRGSIQGHAVIHRGRISGHHRLYNDYFSENHVYTPSQF
ncbi:hypothetical protein CKAN_00476600 [Cinnamomum micranthum f. kanehirae]|uniref:Uncharacterized protein n=1 Tax=Cinnamomum micranthum f. kanehirae TaxID=337451 RepID=A0A3S3MH66_9MAGN|nr:hypothetical protein CKAN_00476600 [Cinnamomum micranthum f. kanehirae]